jgi:protein-tyrosine-phosphatase
MKKAGERNARQRAERARDHAITLMANAVTKGNDKQAKKWKEAAAEACALLVAMDKGERVDADGAVHKVDPTTGEDI